jgi:hypothetical protein
MIREFVSSKAFAEQVNPSGSCRQPVNLDYNLLSNNVMSLAFFEKIKECSGITSGAGSIKGCFEETYNGIVVNDMLREMILNPDSENQDVLSPDDKSQLIYAIFCMLVVGM